MRMRAVYVLVLANVVAWVAFPPFPAGVGAPWWHFVAYAFSHGPWWHLALNMAGLLTLGLGVERSYGAGQFLALYLALILAAVGLQTGLAPTQPVIGASGAVFGLMALYAGLHPDRRVYLLVLPLAARTLVVTYVGMELVLAVSGWVPTVAHWCHLGGILGAIGVYPFLLRKDDEHATD